MHPIPCTELFSSLPDQWDEDLRPHIAGLVKTDGRKVVVLDDDPTGTQTVHGIPVLIRWTRESLQAESRGKSFLYRYTGPSGFDSDSMKGRTA